MINKKHLSTIELAKLLGVSRITVFNKIKSGKIPAEKVGRNYVIPVENIQEIVKTNISAKDKLEIEKAVKKIVEEYGETLRLLGKE